MASVVEQLFDDHGLVEKISRRLPHLFHYAERDSSRAGKVGMEVGSLREKILVSLLIHEFGRSNIETELPITSHDVDVLIHRERLSIKSLTTKSIKIAGVKAIWTVDASQAKNFAEAFTPTSDYLIAHIFWGGKGGLYFVPLASQMEIFEGLGRQKYLKLPKPGTNPRGVEVSSNAMQHLIRQPAVRQIEIDWQRPEGDYDPYARWIEYWALD